jgi:hypothetical protein
LEDRKVVLERISGKTLKIVKKTSLVCFENQDKLSTYMTGGNNGAGQQVR